MIYLTSDPHGVMTEAILRYERDAGDEDLLIILGDTGLWFAEREDWKEFTGRFLQMRKKIAVVYGNHENFPKIAEFPLIPYAGGMARKLTDSIVYLERGYCFRLEGKSFFVMGGCKSSSKWKEMGLWYPEEVPGREEISRAYAELEKADYQVDYILTHAFQINYLPEDAPLVQLNRFLDEKVHFRKWYSGHTHVSSEPDALHRTVYDELLPLEL